MLGLSRPARPPVRLHVRALLLWARGTICDGREQFPGRSSGQSGESLLGSRRERAAGRDRETPPEQEFETD